MLVYNGDVGSGIDFERPFGSLSLVPRSLSRRESYFGGIALKMAESMAESVVLDGGMAGRNRPCPMTEFPGGKGW